MIQSGYSFFAIKHFDRSLEIRPNDAPTLDGRGAAHAQSGFYEEALADLDAAYTQARFANSLFGRGLMKIRLGDKTGGDADIAQAKKSLADVERYLPYFGGAPN